MKILLVPNALKGSLSAREMCTLAQAVLTKHTVKAFPISDGGDGLLDFFKTLDPHAKKISVTARNAFLQPKRTEFLLTKNGKGAVVETARICGLANAKKLDPLGACSYGVGEVILQAVKRGAKEIWVGLGGVACNDGGAGMAAACGAKLTDKNGKIIPLGAAPLLRATHVDLTDLKKQLKGVKIFGIADVTNPLLGKKSSAKVFGPQKGATPAQVKELDKAMAVWARLLKKATGKTISNVPSTAAAGAIAAGLYGAFDAQLYLGADLLLQKAHLEKYVQWADLIITAEGKLDGQTFYGKAPLAVLKLAKKYRKKTLFICGQLDEKVLSKNQYAPDILAVLTDFAPSVEYAKAHAKKYVRQILKSI